MYWNHIMTITLNPHFENVIVPATLIPFSSSYCGLHAGRSAHNYKQITKINHYFTFPLLLYFTNRGGLSYQRYTQSNQLVLCTIFIYFLLRIAECKRIWRLSYLSSLISFIATQRPKRTLRWESPVWNIMKSPFQLSIAILPTTLMCYLALKYFWNHLKKTVECLISL